MFDLVVRLLLSVLPRGPTINVGRAPARRVGAGDALNEDGTNDGIEGTQPRGAGCWDPDLLRG